MTVQIIENVLKLSNKLGLALRTYGLPLVEPHIDLELHDFYFTGDDYRYQFETEAKQRFIDVLRDRFNAGVTYKGRVLKWDTVIELKAIELAVFL